MQNLETDIPLAPYTTFKIGGPARYLARATDLDGLHKALEFAKGKGLKIFILGGGSNVLVGDGGFDGLVIKIELSGVERQDDTYVAAAGESWDALVARSVADGMWGLENLSGIPGSVGGACVQNIGAYGAALSQTLVWVDALDIFSGKVVQMKNSECGFGYRTSTFKQHPGQYVILRAAFQLSSAPNPNFDYRDPTKAYKDLSRVFADKPDSSLADIRSAVLSIRADKFPDLAQEGTAGSFFLNPMVSAAEAVALKERYPDMPLFAMPEANETKVPLGYILDRVLNLKGTSVGGARLFERQALVISVRRGTSAHDVLTLAQKIKQEVKDKTGLDIVEEVKIL